MRSALPVSLIALAALVSPSCCCDDDDDDDCCGGGTPIFGETEPNDDPLTANDFGTLRPGDQFVIEGSVRDDVNDPFDGFAFDTAEPVHVDFELFAGNASADLDVCLYDPQIDQTVACFTSTDDPEVGGVDVFGGGLDFHLVVESFAGDATYSLVITVFSLPRLPMRDADAPGIEAVGARGERCGAAQSGYRKAKPVAAEPAPLIRLEHVIDVDEATGLVIVRRTLVEG